MQPATKKEPQRKQMRKRVFKISLLLSLTILNCADEAEYPEQARKFYTQYAQSPEIARLLRYGIKLRNRTLYLQACQPTPVDSIKIWAVYENYPRDHAIAEIELVNLKIAFTPFADSRGGRIIPEYETIAVADTAGSAGQTVLQIREIIRAFNRLGMREVICGGQGVVYLVQPKFMLIHAADPAKAPASIKNIAAQLDENWYFEISLEHQDEERHKLSAVLRELWQSAQEQKAQQQQTETNK